MEAEEWERAAKRKPDAWSGTEMLEVCIAGLRKLADELEKRDG